MPDYEELASDFKIDRKAPDILCWSIRGKVIGVKTIERVEQLRRQGLIWRRVNKKEIEEGAKIGHYSAVFDQGKEAKDKQLAASLVDQISSFDKNLSDSLEVIEI